MEFNNESEADDTPACYVAVLTRLLPHGIPDVLTMVLREDTTVDELFDWVKTMCQGGVSFVRLEITEAWG